MSHVADLHNSGRCGTHRNQNQALGAFYQQIGKEKRTLERTVVNPKDELTMRIQQMEAEIDMEVRSQAELKKELAYLQAELAKR